MTKPSGDDPSDPSRSDPATRKASLLLSGLVVTPDEALPMFRDRRAADRSLDIVHLRRARDLLDAIAAAIGAAQPAKWKAIERAWQALQPDAPAAGPAVVDASAPAGLQEAASAARQEPATPSPAAPSVVDATSSSSAVGSAPALPSVPGPVGSLVQSAVAPLPGAAPASPWAGSRAPVAPSPPVAFPVAPPPPPPPPRASPPADAAAIDRLLGKEATLPADARAPVQVLPFRKAEAQPPAPERPRPRDPLGNTASEIMSPLRIVTLPFRKAEASGDHGPAAAAEPAAEGAPAGDDAQTDDLLELSTDDPDFQPTTRIERGRSVEAAPAPPSPGASPLPAHLESMSVEHYAALCAECAVHPEWIAQTHARYHVQDDGQRQLLDRAWQQRMAADPRLADAWRWHYTRYEQWARTPRR